MFSKEEVTSRRFKELRPKNALAEYFPSINSIPRPKRLQPPKIPCLRKMENDTLYKILQKRHVRISSGFDVSLDAWGYVRKRYISQFGPILKNLKFLPKFTVKATISEDCYLNNLVSTVRNLNSVLSASEVIFDISHCRVTNNGVQNFCSLLKQFRSLRALVLRFSDNQDISQKSLKTISASLKSIRPLLMLDLSFFASKNTRELLSEDFATNFMHSAGYPHGIKDSNFADLCSKMKYYSHPSILKLTFPDFGQITDEAIYALCANFQRIRELLGLKLEFSDSRKITNSSIQSILLSTAHFASIKDLDLGFSRCNNISDEGFEQLSSTLSGFPSLESLKLCFMSCTKVTDRTIMNLSEGLAHLLNLSALDLNFSCCSKITTIGFEALSKNLKLLSLLAILDLNFSGCKNIADRDFVELSSSMKCLKLLESLHMNFQFSQISDNGVKGITSSLSPSVSVLSLNLSSCGKVTGKGIESLFSNLQTIPALSVLVLNLSFCTGVTDKSIRSASLGFKYLTSLAKLDLNLASCRNLTDIGFKNIRLALTRLTFLDRLTLDFEQCPEITNASAEGILLDIPGLSPLSETNLSFLNCNKVLTRALREAIWDIQYKYHQFKLDVKYTETEL